MAKTPKRVAVTGAAGQFDFTGNQFARLPFAGLQALRDERLDLLVQWGKCG